MSHTTCLYLDRIVRFLATSEREPHDRTLSSPVPRSRIGCHVGVSQLLLLLTIITKDSLFSCAIALLSMRVMRAKVLIVI